MAGDSSGHSPLPPGEEKYRALLARPDLDAWVYELSNDIVTASLKQSKLDQPMQEKLSIPEITPRSYLAAAFGDTESARQVRDSFMQRAVQGFVEDFIRQTAYQTTPCNRHRAVKDGKPDPWADLPLSVARKDWKGVPRERMSEYMEACGPSFFHASAMFNGLLDRKVDSSLAFDLMKHTVRNAVTMFRERYPDFDPDMPPVASVRDDTTEMVLDVFSRRTRQADWQDRRR